MRTKIKKTPLRPQKAYYKKDQELMTRHIDTLYLMKDDVRKENYSREFKREIISLIAKYSYSLDEYLSFTKELEYINDLPCLYYVNAMTRKACEFNQSGKIKSAILHAKEAKKALKRIMKIAVGYDPTSETLSDLAKCYFLIGDKNNFRRLLKVLNSQKNESQVDKLIYLNLLKFQMLHEKDPVILMNRKIIILKLKSVTLGEKMRFLMPIIISFIVISCGRSLKIRIWNLN